MLPMNITNEYVSFPRHGARRSGSDHSSLAAARRSGTPIRRGDYPMILKRAGSVLVTSAALTGVLGLSAGSAIAAINGVAATWTVKPGGAITAKAGTTTLKDTNTGSTLTCASSSGKGSVKSGSGLSGTGVTTGTITGIHATLSGPSCSAVVDGTGPTANNGRVTAKYSNGTGKLTTTGAGNLHIYHVSGCAGLIHSGDGSSFHGSYTISPKQIITSP